MTGRGIDQAMARPSRPGLYEPLVSDAREYLRLAEQANGNIPAPVDAAYVWGEALAELERLRPHARIVNLETAVTTSEKAWPGKGIHYRMHPANLGCLTVARIDACVLANNHVLDWGHAGLAETLRTLRDAGMRTAGAGADLAQATAPAVLPLPGGARVLVFSWATSSSGVPEEWAARPDRAGIALLPDLSETSARQVAAVVGRHRRAGDLVAVSIHWGGNWGLHVPQEHRAFAHRLIELGAADLLHGHSSHHPLPIEVHRDKLVLYGCGDLINDYEGIGTHGGLRSDVGCLYAASLAAGSGRLRRLEIVPMQLRRLRLQRADAQAIRWLEEVFQCGSPQPATRLQPRPEGGWSLRWG